MKISALACMVAIAIVPAEAHKIHGKHTTMSASEAEQLAALETELEQLESQMQKAEWDWAQAGKRAGEIARSLLDHFNIGRA